MPKLFLISSFLIWSNLVHPLTVLKFFISAALILFQCLFLSVHVSLPYKSSGTAIILYNFRFASFLVFFFNVLAITPNIFEIYLIYHLNLHHICMKHYPK
jgi:hypothetical protein